MLQKLTKFVYWTKTFLIVHQIIRLILDDPTSQTKHQLLPYPQGQLKAENRKKSWKKMYARFFLCFMNFHLALKGFSYCSCTSKLHTFSSKWFHFKIHVHAKRIKNPFSLFFAKTFIARAKTSIEWKAGHRGTWRGPTALVDEKCFNTIKWHFAPQLTNDWHFFRTNCDRHHVWWQLVKFGSIYAFTPNETFHCTMLVKWNCKIWQFHARSSLVH